MTLAHLSDLLNQKPYDFPQKNKNSLFIRAIKEVTLHHYQNCIPYKNLCQKKGFNPSELSELFELPYLPTSIFKDALLLSVPKDKVFRIINSSATSTGKPSRIGLDRETSQRQSKCFNKVALNRLGNQRRKFIILDIPESIFRTKDVTARSSTIRSLLFCANKVHTCVEDVAGKLTLDQQKLDELLKEAERNHEEVVIFGFTYILYSFVLRPLSNNGKKYKMKNSKIIHIGGWKKLEDEKVSSEELVTQCKKVFGVNEGDVVDFYGFTEQSGMIYPSCEAGARHVPAWGEVIVRDKLTLQPLRAGQNGLLQFITPIQTSYPGHSVLTEDEGFVIGVDNCPCGRKGTAFKVIGRAQNAEVRGCGDIMAEKFA